MEDNNLIGQEKCPQCGATDISMNPKTGLLRCNFCRHEFEPQVVEKTIDNLLELEGEHVSKGADKIDGEFDSQVTIKCQSCGAEVVIDTNESAQARCHWCRNTLSINDQIPNGATPDMVLPFNVPREEARTLIDGFVGKRQFFAHPRFKAEFTSENVMGVYFPYMVVDMNTHASFSGEAEHLVREYTVTVGSGDDKHTETRYDADLYEVARDFDMTIEGLTVESNSDKLVNDSAKTNNIINSIMPFDTENSVKWDANYLRGFTSEKRDVDVEQLRPIVGSEAKDIARFAAADSMDFYDRGVKWTKQDLNVKGASWKSAYLPVWLYSYHEKKGGTSLLHYVAVNARTKETMGSVPIHVPKLLSVSAIVEVIAFICMLFVQSTIFDGDDSWIACILLLAGPIYYLLIYMKYRNTDARHYHESETKRDVYNLQQKDDFVKHRKGLSNSRMNGENGKEVKASFTGGSFSGNALNKMGINK